jgi:mRNA interferase HigB
MFSIFRFIVIHSILLDEFAKCEFNSRSWIASWEPHLHVISRRRLLEAAEEHGDLGESLDIWYRIAKRAEWRSLADVRQIFPSADGVGAYTVFNIKGNRYRLICEINYGTSRVYIRQVLTHADYSKGARKG